MVFPLTKDLKRKAIYARLQIKSQMDVTVPQCRQNIYIDFVFIKKHLSGKTHLNWRFKYITLLKIVRSLLKVAWKYILNS